MPKGKKGFVKGDPNINREGLNKGSGKEKSFVEYFNEIAEEIALANKMSVDDVKKVIYKVGYAKAKEGNYQFYKDILDRIHGQATQKFGGDPENPLFIQISEAIAKKNDINPMAKPSSE